MGAGIDPKVLRRKLYRRLMVVRNALTTKGVPYEYKDLEIQGEHFSIFWAGAGPASNGEIARWLVLRFNEKENPSGSLKRPGDVDYTNFHTRDIPELDKGGFDSGLKKIIEHAAKTPTDS